MSTIYITEEELEVIPSKKQYEISDNLKSAIITAKQLIKQRNPNVQVDVHITDRDVVLAINGISSKGFIKYDIAVWEEDGELCHNFI